jgi:hypothetical protein
MGLFYLKLLDEGVERAGLAYARFMDDWVILAPTRWKLRAAICLLNDPFRRRPDSPSIPTAPPAPTLRHHFRHG